MPWGYWQNLGIFPRLNLAWIIDASIKVLLIIIEIQ